MSQQRSMDVKPGGASAAKPRNVCAQRDVAICCNTLSCTRLQAHGIQSQDVKGGP
eukprot:CAMPEP_0115306874 /NCGR_PEP_ID=MMETSP0270-20121206/72829_1 /TAXON_ID=71861 /ORGANISM="Scrippsiella trochoidea, Strain CCMP3099" /LENGTH=54 /DNA_ID=CAMNT_0002725257 /DNA_START=69 /DNA_END=231 /DNA_ORIENTATION=+